MSNLCTSNVTSGFIDLATFDELEKYLYGGQEATAYFVRETRKSTWFTQVPVVLSRAAGTPAFNTEWSVSISRAGDYLLNTWLRVVLPKVEVDTNKPNTFVAWTRNVMHNLVAECCITFNDLVAARFDNYHLDFWSAFTVPASKRVGYNHMIGDIDELTRPSKSLQSVALNLPLPFFFTRDSGVALPTAALPYNDMRITFQFRNWTDLLCKYEKGTGPDTNNPDVGLTPMPVTVSDLSEEPSLSSGNVQVWANYAIVSNDERKRMACAPRDILIEQVQTAPSQSFNPSTNSSPSYDIRFSHAIKVLFFSARNETHGNVWSNYTTASPVVSLADANADTDGTIDFDDGVDPIENTSFIYENTQRLSRMGSDYFSLVQPFYHARVVPEETGYHMYSYSLDFCCLDPMGSTNYGKLTNVSVVPEASAGAENSVGQKFKFITTAVNNNIIRVSGGALGFPVL